MTTTDKPNYSQEAYLVIKEAGGQEMTPSDVADIFEARGLPMKREVVSAIVAGLPKGTAGRTGVVRVAKGTYAYRPDLVENPPHVEKTTKVPTGTYSNKIRDFLKVNGPRQVTTKDIVAATGLKGRQINQAMAHLLRSGEVTRVKPGTYQPVSPNGHTRPTENTTFGPVVDAISDQAFADVGLRIVARTKDGDRLAVDEKGTAWAVKVTVTAQLV